MNTLISVLAEMIDWNPIEMINTDFEIPYLAGYSLDGHTIYIDKRLPRYYKIKNGRIIDIFKYLAWHEAAEKFLEDGTLTLTQQQWKDFNDWLNHKKITLRTGYSYPYAHELATGLERYVVEKDDIDWDEYQNYMLKMVKKLEKFSGPLPLDLDTKPEKDSHDRYRYQKIKKIQKEQKNDNRDTVTRGRS